MEHPHSLDQQSSLDIESTLDRPPSLDTFSSTDNAEHTLDLTFTIMTYEDGEFMTNEDNIYMRFES